MLISGKKKNIILEIMILKKENEIPKGYKIRKDGKIKSRQILFGLNQEFYREAA